jgi:hypothetical protein
MAFIADVIVTVNAAVLVFNSRVIHSRRLHGRGHVTSQQEISYSLICLNQILITTLPTAHRQNFPKNILS